MALAPHAAATAPPLPRPCRRWMACVQCHHTVIAAVPRCRSPACLAAAVMFVPSHGGLRMLLLSRVPPHPPALPHHHRRAHSRAPPRQVFLCSFAHKLNTIFSMLSDSFASPVRACAPIACAHCTWRGPLARSSARISRPVPRAQAPGHHHRHTRALGQGGARWLRVLLALCMCVVDVTGRPGYRGGQHVNKYAFAALKADGSIMSWGDTRYGGSGAPTDAGYVDLYSNVMAFAARKADGSITAWGSAENGGSGAPADSGYATIYSTQKAFAAVKADGSITAWGDSDSGGSGAPISPRSRLMARSRRGEIGTAHHQPTTGTR